MRNLLNGVLVYEEGPIEIVQDKLEETPHKDPQEDVEQEEEKVVRFTKTSTSKWIGEFSPNISRNDINRLRIAILSEFSKMKRRSRLSRRVSDRVNKELEHVS